MANLINLVNELINDIPELKPTFFNMSSTLGKLTFAGRLEKNLTQKELAEIAGVGVKTIHRIEGGSGGITDKTYEKVFAALELSNEDISEAFKGKPFTKVKSEIEMSVSDILASRLNFSNEGIQVFTASEFEDKAKTLKEKKENQKL